MSYVYRLSTREFSLDGKLLGISHTATDIPPGDYAIGAPGPRMSFDLSPGDFAINGDLPKISIVLDTQVQRHIATSGTRTLTVTN